MNGNADDDRVLAELLGVEENLIKRARLALEESLGSKQIALSWAQLEQQGEQFLETLAEDKRVANLQNALGVSDIELRTYIARIADGNADDDRALAKELGVKEHQIADARLALQEKLGVMTDTTQKFGITTAADTAEATRATAVSEGALERTAAVDLETMRNNAAAVRLTMTFENETETRIAKEAFDKLMFGKESERITDVEEARHAFKKELQDNEISAARAAQMTDQVFSAEMQDDAQEFAGGEAKEGRTHALLMQSNAISAAEKDRAQTIAASVDAALLDKIFAGDQAAFDRAVQDKTITLADAQFYAGLGETVRATDQADTTKRYAIDTAATTADEDRDAIFDLETVRNNNQVLLLTLNFENDKEKATATRAFQESMYGKETDRLTSRDDSREAFELKLQALGIEGNRAAQISGQLFQAELQDDAQAFAGTEAATGRAATKASEDANRVEGGRQADAADATNVLRIETGAATSDKNRASAEAEGAAERELARERMTHISNENDKERQARIDAVLDKAAVDGVWTKAAFDMHEILLVNAGLVKVEDGELIITGPKRVKKWNRQYINDVRNVIHTNLTNRGASPEAIAGALAVTTSSMRDEKGPIAFIHRLFGLEQPYGAGPDYDNPDKGPFSMTGGWERTTQPARLNSGGAPTTPDSANPSSTIAASAGKGPIMMGPDVKISTGGASMTSKDFNNGLKKGQGFLRNLFPANANGDGAGSERVRFPRPQDHRQEAARRLHPEGHPEGRARPFAHGLCGRRVRPAEPRPVRHRQHRRGHYPARPR